MVVFLVYSTVSHPTATVQTVVSAGRHVLLWLRGPALLALLAFSVGANYGLGIAVEQARSEASRRILVLVGHRVEHRAAGLLQVLRVLLQQLRGSARLVRQGSWPSRWV